MILPSFYKQKACSVEGPGGFSVVLNDIQEFCKSSENGFGPPFLKTSIHKYNKNAIVSVDSHKSMTLKTFTKLFIWKNDIINTTESTLNLEER